MSGRPAATTTCIRGADWVVAWDARTRRVYRFHVDVAFEGETSSGLGYAGLYPGAGGKSQLPTFATAIAVLLSAEAGRAAPPDKTTVVNYSKGTITCALTGTGPVTARPPGYVHRERDHHARRRDPLDRRCHGGHRCCCRGSWTPRDPRRRTTR